MTESKSPTKSAPRTTKYVAEETTQPMEVRETHEIDSGKRRMPEYLNRHLIRVQSGKFYLPAASRIVWFRDECPDWGIDTFLVEGGQEAGFASVQAKIYNPEGRLIASGIKTETRQDFPAGWVEKAETGAIARALAVAGYGTQFAPDMDEDPNRPVDSPQRGAYRKTDIPRDVPRVPVTEVWEGPELCPNCHAPAGKRHGKPCIA